MSTTDAPDVPLETFSAATRARFGDESASWVAAIPATIADLASRWSLDLAGASATEDRYTVEAQRGEDPRELELTYPDGWWEEATRALEAWRGDGTQRLFEQDPRGGRLLERHVPAPVELDEVAALRDVCAVARRLWISAPDGVTTVAVEVRAWASEMQERHRRAGRPYERELVRSAADLLSTLGPTQGDRVLLHGDLHLTSLALADDRRVLLGPRPLVGEREFDAASLLRDTPADLIVDVDRGRDRVKTRFAVLNDELSCNPTRLRGWAFATAVDQAVWSAENGDHATGAALVEVARMIRALEV